MEQLDKPFIIPSKIFEDHRGFVFHNNSFDLSRVKRVYEIQNRNENVQRGWKGHVKEARWFYCTNGKYTIKVRTLIDKSKIGSYEYTFSLKYKTGDVLYVPKNYATLLKQDFKDSSVLCFSDYSFQDREKDIRIKI